MKKILYIFLILIFSISCTDLEIEPTDVANAEVVFEDPNQYVSFLGKLYAGLSLSGQSIIGLGDVAGGDEPVSQFFRGLFFLQEITTDMSVSRLGDAGIPGMHEHQWNSSNEIIQAFYFRTFFQVSMCNEFLRQSTPEVLAERNVPEELSNEISTLFRAEARFLRALSYYYGLDLFRNIPLYDETHPIGTAPTQASPRQVFDFIESELLAIEEVMANPLANPYGRADRAAVWFLLARLYLNAEVYIGESRYSECLEFCNKIINSGAYNLANNYIDNFLADNHNSPEIIFPVPFDQNTQSFGGMFYLTHMQVGGSIPPELLGIGGGFAGMRTTTGLTQLFPDLDGTTDSRSGLFWTEGQQEEITDFQNFRHGIGVIKFRNVTADGTPGADPTFPDTDFPFFRLADVNLMYAEAVLRGGTGGDRATALSLINQIRERAYGNLDGNIEDDALTLDFILDERARELYYEMIRRTDLVRYNLFTENGIWPFKGGVQEGVTTDAFRNIFPIPAADIIANPNLTQNEGY